MKRLLFLTAAAVSLVAPLACDLEKLTAEKAMVGTLLSTPAAHAVRIIDWIARTASVGR